MRLIYLYVVEVETSTNTQTFYRYDDVGLFHIVITYMVLDFEILSTDGFSLSLLIFNPQRCGEGCFKSCLSVSHSIHRVWGSLYWAPALPPLYNAPAPTHQTCSNLFTMKHTVGKRAIVWLFSRKFSNVLGVHTTQHRDR